MTGADLHRRRSGKDAGDTACESAGRTVRIEGYGWLVAVLTLLGVTVVLDALDLLLWINRGIGLGAPPLVWAPAVVRIVLLCTLSGCAFCFFKLASRLRTVNGTLATDLDLQAHLLAEKNAEVARLKRLSDTLINQVDLKPALNLALEIATDVVGARTASIMLLDPARQELTIAAARGLPEKIVGSVRVKIGEGLAGLVAQEGEAIVINSDDLNERLAPLAHRTHEIKSAIIAPIKIDGEVRGVINVSDKRDAERWREEDLAAVSTLASQAAMVLQKIELYDNLQQQVAMLQEALQEFERTQAGLIQSEKLASIGQIAGGVAHEINNPLMVILGRLEFALERLQPNDPVSKDLQIVLAQTERIAELVRNLLNFSRVSSAEDFRPVAVNDPIEKTLSLTELQMSKQHIEVVRKLSEDLPVIWGNPGQVQQVFVNIAINAYQAMSELGGTLTVSTWAEKRRVFVRFADTGPGVPPEERERIFEPFYTTKGEAEGTGLGLAISRGIVHTHGGRIEAGGEPGKGAVFTVELPAMDAHALLGEDKRNEQEKHNGRRRRERDTQALPRCA